MARGYVFEVSTTPCIGHLEEADLYDYAGSLADYFQDLSDDEQEDCRQNLLSRFAAVGAEIGEEDELLYFQFSETSKKAYFKQQYESFMNLVKDLTLERYIEEGWKIRQLVENNYQDLVYFDYPYSVDAFVRNVEIGKKYYLGNVVLAH